MGKHFEPVRLPESYLPFTGGVAEGGCICSARSVTETDGAQPKQARLRGSSGCSFPSDCAEVIPKCEITVEPAL